MVTEFLDDKFNLLNLYGISSFRSFWNCFYLVLHEVNSVTKRNDYLAKTDLRSQLFQLTQQNIYFI